MSSVSLIFEWLKTMFLFIVCSSCSTGFSLCSYCPPLYSSVGSLLIGLDCFGFVFEFDVGPLVVSGFPGFGENPG